MRIRDGLRRIRTGISSPRGKDMLVFCLALAGATLLWFSKALNEEVTRDVRCPVQFVNVPDSVHRVTPTPEAINVSVRGAGLQLILRALGSPKPIRIDYQHYQRHNSVDLSQLQLRALARQAMGQGSTINAIQPDTLSAKFTTRPPVRLPVTVDARITTMPNCALTGHPVASTDSVWVYSLNPLPEGMTTVVTQPLRLTDVSEGQTVRVPLSTPRYVLADPDTISVSFKVEPMISRTQKVAIRTVNVPAGTKLILMPSTVNVNYMMPMSRYNDARPDFTVVADYNSLGNDFSNNHIGIRLSRATGNFLNVYLQTDSVEYIIEKR